MQLIIPFFIKYKITEMAIIRVVPTSNTPSTLPAIAPETLSFPVDSV